MDFLRYLSGFRTLAGEQIFQIITYFGQQIFLILLLCLILWCVDKRLAYCIGFSFCLSGMLVQGMKIIFCIPRPWILDSDFQPVLSAKAGATGYSFPSGHTQSATALFGSIGVKSKKLWIRLLCIIVFLLVGFSRMYLGVHTPKDVLVSMGITLAAVAFSSWIGRNGIFPKYSLVFLAVLAFFAFGFADVRYVTGAVSYAYAADVVKLAGVALGFITGCLFEQKYVQYDVKAPFKWQAVKVIAGLLLTLGLKTGLKLILGGSLAGDALRYFILIVFIVAIYPMIFTKIQRKH